MSAPSATPATVESQILALLVGIAPDVDPAAVLPGLPFRDQFDFDSMDFFNFAIALNRHFGIDIPERDYRELSSLEGCAAYVRNKLPRAG